MGHGVWDDAERIESGQGVARRSVTEAVVWGNARGAKGSRTGRGLMVTGR